MKIILMGTPQFAIPAFEAIHKKYPNTVKMVFTKPDAPKGRGQTFQASDVGNWAHHHHLPTAKPKHKTEIEPIIKSIQPDVIIVIAYGMILPKSITDTTLCINAHASILPQYRGASPIHSALLNQDTQTGVTLIKMNEKMDEGDCITTAMIPITSQDNFQTLHDRLSHLSEQLLLTILETLLTGTELKTTAQDHTKATYCKKIEKSDLELLKGDTPKKQLGKIKAFSPAPGAYIVDGKKRIKIIDAQLDSSGNIDILQVKPEGKKTMSYKDYLHAHPPIRL